MPKHKQFEANSLFQVDEKLKTVDRSWGKAASSESIERTKKALETKGHKVHVAKNGSSALEQLKRLIPKGASLFSASSMTLQEIGYTDWIIAAGAEYKNWNERVVAEKDAAKQTDLRREANLSDYYLTSVAALAETGELVIVDASGSRVSGLPFTAKNGKKMKNFSSNRSDN